MVAQQTLTLFVWVRILVGQPQQRKSTVINRAFFVISVFPEIRSGGVLYE